MAKKKKLPAGPHHIADAIRRAKDQEWIIKDLLPRPGLFILAGAPKVGKTYLMMALARCIASGVSFLGSFAAVAKFQAMYTQLEDHPELMDRRLRALFGPKGADLTDMDCAMYYFAGQEGLAQFETGLKLEDRAPVFGVIDPLDFLLAIQKIEENEAGPMRLEIARWRQYAVDHDDVLFIVHHLRKSGDQMRGSGALQGAVDGYFYLIGGKGPNVGGENAPGGVLEWLLRLSWVLRAGVSGQIAIKARRWFEDGIERVSFEAATEVELEGAEFKAEFDLGGLAGTQRKGKGGGRPPRNVEADKAAILGAFRKVNGSPMSQATVRSNLSDVGFDLPEKPCIAALKGLVKDGYLKEAEAKGAHGAILYQPAKDLVTPGN